MFEKTIHWVVTEEAIKTLSRKRDDPAIAQALEDRVRHVARNNGDIWTETQLQHVVQRVLRDWQQAVNNRIFQIISEY